eukprot:s5287_g1.t1
MLAATVQGAWWVRQPATPARQPRGRCGRRSVAGGEIGRRLSHVKAAYKHANTTRRVARAGPGGQGNKAGQQLLQRESERSRSTERAVHGESAEPDGLNPGGLDALTAEPGCPRAGVDTRLFCFLVFQLATSRPIRWFAALEIDNMCRLNACSHSLVYPWFLLVASGDSLPRCSW